MLSTSKTHTKIPVLSLTAMALTAAGCASAHKSAAPDAALLASIPAELRMMGTETTWVAHGVGYELVTRSKLEIPPLLSQLDDQSRYFAREFGADPGKIVAAVRRVGPPGALLEASAPVPYNVGPVVELVVPRPLAKGEKIEKSDDESSPRGSYGRGSRGGTGRGSSGSAGQDTTGAAMPDAGDPERFGAVGPTGPVVRAWLAARATSLTGKPASDLAASARVDDPRVPAWAEEALPGLAVPTGREDTTTARLSMQIDSLYPIYSFLTMARPGTIASNGRGGTSGRGTPTGGGGGGFSGGRRGGGMGGMGGMGGGYGRSGSRSGGGNPRAGDPGNYRGPLSGNALFAAEALVFGRYLTVREGPAFVGTLVDAQIQSKNISDVFAKAQMVPSNLERLDIEFRRWLIDRATHTK